MVPITTIVHFQVPAENVERFFAFWRDHIQNNVEGQPGLIDGVFHRGIDPDGPHQFINVAHWDSAEALASGLRAMPSSCPWPRSSRISASKYPLRCAGNSDGRSGRGVRTSTSAATGWQGMVVSAAHRPEQGDGSQQ